jgi:hypothetical protein
MLRYLLGSVGAEAKATWLGVFGELLRKSFPLEELARIKVTL